MREILFRGKRIDNGEWIKGDLIENQGDHYIYEASDVTTFACGCTTEVSVYCNQVIPETVGQFTGLTDKNGKRIFEGDIVRKPELYMNAVGVIRYGGTHFRCSCKEYPDLGIWTLDEVIGNIHDNPELLKGGEINE